MENSNYIIESSVQENHWWFLVRREFFRKILLENSFNTSATILDIGTSTGTNLKLLKDLNYENTIGIDYSKVALDFCTSKGFNNLLQANVYNLPLPDASVDLILLTDILEHVNDRQALSEVLRVLKPGGKVLITVPAFQCLWGNHDDASQHLRRYRLPQLKALLKDNGLNLIENNYFNFILFLPILFVRKFIRIFSIPINNDNHINNSLLNKVLYRVFSFDVFLSRKLKPPFGVSIFALVEKKERL